MSDVMEFKNGQPPFAVSIGNMDWNKTGSWRYMRPLYENKVPPCTAGCPAHEKIPQYFALVKEKKYREAWYTILEDNPMPGVMGRVCYHPCETVCNRGEFDDSIAIHNMERFVADQNKDNHFPELFIQGDYSEKIAIIGSGPAGLSAAYQLRRKGYNITIFEAAPKAGGMLRLGIPKYRLPSEILDKEIGDILGLGIELKTNIRVGKDLVWEDLKKSYDAVLIASGAFKSWPMNLKGENKKGISSGLSFLREFNINREVPVGKKVVVVGGGNTAIDTARSALRMGAEVTVVYRRSRAEMPAVPEEVEDAEKEGVKIVFLANPVEFLGNEKVEKVKLIKMKLGEPDASGRRRPIPQPGSEFEIVADQVLLSIGEMPDLSFLPDDFAKNKGRLVVNSGQMSNEKGVFVSGDAADGPVGTVVEAINTGKRAAFSIHHFLREGQPLEMKPVVNGVPYQQINLDYFINEKRPQEKKLQNEDLNNNFKEVNFGIDEEQAIREADRCFSCGTCTYCDNCLIFCPDVAISFDLTKREYVINYDYCKGCGICVNECPRDAMSFEEELKWRA